MTALQLLGVSEWFSLLSFPLLLAFVVMHIVAVSFIPAMLAAKDTDPREVGKAVYAYLLLGFGALLVIVGVLPLLVSLFSLQRLPVAGYGALAVLVIGGSTVLFLLAKRLCAGIDPKAAAVPRAIYFCMLSLIGVLLCIAGVLSFLIGGMSALVAGQTYQPVRFWVVPICLFFTGTGILALLRYGEEGKFRCLCK